MIDYVFKDLKLVVSLFLYI